MRNLMKGWLSLPNNTPPLCQRWMAIVWYLPLHKLWHIKVTPQHQPQLPLHFGLSSLHHNLDIDRASNYCLPNLANKVYTINDQLTHRTACFCVAGSTNVICTISVHLLSTHLVGNKVDPFTITVIRGRNFIRPKACPKLIHSRCLPKLPQQKPN